MVGDRHFLVAGGGGSAKTGVANAMEIFELKHENKTITARKVTHYETESMAVMNCDIVRQEKHFIVAAGLENSCRLYTLRYKVITPKVENEALEGLRKRKGNLTISNEHKNASKMIGFEIEPGEDVVTDSTRDGGGFQKVVRFVSDASQVITAGADGHFRVWKVPKLDKVHDVAAHTNEVDDLDLSPDGSQVVTVSRDNHAYLWNAKDASRLHELIWNTSTTYRFRSCRFGVVIDKEGTFNLYTSHIPVVRSTRPNPCFIVKWDPLKAVPTKVLNAGSEILSAMAVSDNGVYLATGTISGSVSVYVSFSLQRIYHMSEVHRIFVTGLEFVTSDASQAVIGQNVDFTLFSISADSQVKVHQQDSRSLYSPLWALLGFLLIIFIIYWLVSAFEL
jgi:prolactin regulatory element-binding protein